MSRLTELLRQVRKADAQLGTDLEAEVAALTKCRTFGLVFEQHQPEAVELPGRVVRRGDKVRVLPPRGGQRQVTNGCGGHLGSSASTGSVWLISRSSTSKNPRLGQCLPTTWWSSRSSGIASTPAWWRQAGLSGAATSRSTRSSTLRTTTRWRC